MRLDSLVAGDASFIVRGYDEYSGGLTEAHPGLVRTEHEVRMTTDPRTKGNDDVQSPCLVGSLRQVA